MAPLHKINPLRLTYIRDAACRKFERNVKSLNCLSGLRILDIGCGAGLLCEPFTRLGAQVIGVDPSASNIAAARLHADKGHLSIDYRCTTVEQMDVRERFDIVLAMEVVEHVTDVGMFLDRCAAMLKPGGMMVISTLNRNWKSFALAIVGAEYVLRWLPRGTHQWDKFVTPDELAHHLENNKLAITEQAGVVYSPFADRWSLSSDMDVNYMVVAEGSLRALLSRSSRRSCFRGDARSGSGCRMQCAPVDRREPRPARWLQFPLRQPNLPHMISIATLWIPFTITAALGQVARNAMQRQLTGPLGTWGATNIRFLFGFPFSIVFFAIVLAATGDHVPWPTAAFWPWLLLGALSQIVATGMMLLAMNDRSFVVTTAYLKTEAIQTAIFGFVFLGDHLTMLKVIAILIATVGVVITALRPGGEKSFADLKPTMLGLVRRGRICAVGGRLSRRDHHGVRRLVRDGGVLYAGVRAVRADPGADDLSVGARA